MSHLIQHPRIIDIAKLKPLAHRAKGKITKLYLHWTAGRYEQVFDDYHISIGKTGTIYLTCNFFLYATFFLMAEKRPRAFKKRGKHTFLSKRSKKVSKKT